MSFIVVFCRPVFAVLQLRIASGVWLLAPDQDAVLQFFAAGYKARLTSERRPSVLPNPADGHLTLISNLRTLVRN